MKYQFAFFTNFRGTNTFVYDFVNDYWTLSEKADMSDWSRYSFLGEAVPYYVNEAFEAENCISDKQGIQIGIYELEA